MRVLLTACCVLCAWLGIDAPARELRAAAGDATDDVVAVREVLREAAEIAAQQPEEQVWWTHRILRQIAELQIRGGDYDGALQSLRSFPYDYNRSDGLVELAEALARDGQRTRALSVLGMLETDDRYPRIDDAVQLRWIEHLIASGELERAGKAVDQLKTADSPSEGWRKLGVGHFAAGNVDRAAEQFARALDAGTNLKDEFLLARVFWRTADAQMTAGAIDAAKATIGRLVDTIEIRDPWAKVTALCESAVIRARADDEPAARRLFLRAIEAAENFDHRMRIDRGNKAEALKLISAAQAAVGYIDEARRTAAIISREGEDRHDSRYDEVLLAVAAAQIKREDINGAVQSALSIKRYRQYHDDALEMIVERQLVTRDLEGAAANAEKIDNASRKATAILRIATVHAKSGDGKTATELVSRIQLVSADPFPQKARFDFRKPETWGECYDWIGAGTMSSMRRSNQRAAEVAGAAMTLAQALGQQPPQSYAVLFDDICIDEVVRALARAHAASGEVSAARGWAEKIGGNWKVRSKDDDGTLRAVKRRIHALIGVAEGILDRSGDIAGKGRP